MHQGVYSAPKYLYNYPPQTVKKWPEDIECIIRSQDPEKGSLYLSNVEAAQNPATVKKLKVGAILSCAKGYIVSHPTHLVPLYKYIPGEDKQTFNISLHFDECVEFIKKALEKTNIIVHCIAGVSRSASMVIAYFMKHRQLTYHQAFHEVKSKRRIISPNDGFIKHLKDYQVKLRSQKSLNSTNPCSRDESPQFTRATTTGNFYSPRKSQQYTRNRQLINSAKNPESSVKEEILSKTYKLQQTALFSPKKNDYRDITNYKNFSQSMTMIPDDKSPSPRFDRYGKSFSKQLSPRKTINYASQKPSYISREQIYNDRNAQKGYFDSMNQQLNAKVQAIKKKYQQQRAQLTKNYGCRGHSIEKQSNKPNIYLDRNQNYAQNSFTTKKNYNYMDRRDNFTMYDKGIDLKLNPRLNNIDSIYIPRISTGYALNYGYYSKKYY